ncbi:hypothetical protein [Vibrio cholerae]|uniref:hypothetical protein n=1 Tax=Vibrio cholerae TaxID=666 RepID=UPI001C2F2617
MKVAIICQSIKYYAGTERVVFELCSEFQRRGIDIHLGAVEIGDFYYNELYPLRINDIPNCMDDLYDMIINFHSFTFGYLFEKGVQAKSLIYFSLSPYEPVEFPFFQSDIIDKILANSEETKEEIVSQGIDRTYVDVFPNSHNFNIDLIYKEKKNEIKRVIIVSNHIPQELRDVIKLAPEIEFTIAGIDDKVKLIDAEFLSEFDAVISIGYTVVTAIQAKIPIYMYDHFGGEGWLTGAIFSRSSHYNFSGRPERKIKSAQDIISELKNGFANALIEVDTLYELMRLERNIEKNMNIILSDIPSDFVLKKPNHYLINASKAYVKLYKMNQHLQNIVSGNCMGENINPNAIQLSDKFDNALDLILRDQKKLISLVNSVNSKIETRTSPISIILRKLSNIFIKARSCQFLFLILQFIVYIE